MNAHEFDWSDLAFSNKSKLKKLDATFIAAPRELSAERFKQLAKDYLPKGNIVLGLAKEEYIDGFEGQPQFKTVDLATVRTTIDKVADSDSKYKIYTLTYFQREAPYIVEKLKPRQTIFINGSWKYSFHTTPLYYTLTTSGLPFELISPFVSEEEAKQYVLSMTPELNRIGLTKQQAEKGMLAVAQEAAKLSYDYNFQTGAVLGKRIKNHSIPPVYEFLGAACNEVVPFKTYAMHYGASRETHFSPPNDLNYYDTVHAEIVLLLSNLKWGFGLKGTTLFINLMPCPACARMLSMTDIDEIVYGLDHSDGYAVKLLERAGKKVRRVVL